MKHLELHILQSVPVSCLNRDDLNSPKTAIFGGVQRARVSSQCWKRAIREMAKEMLPASYKGEGTRRMVYALTRRLVEKGMSDVASVAIAEKVADIIETLDSKKDEDGYLKTKTRMFFSESEYDAIVKTIVSSDEVKKSIKALESALQKNDDKEKENVMKTLNKILDKGPIAKAIKSAQMKDAADIALFGRMVANDHSLTVEAASMFSHAISTHKSDNEIDFFAAIDDLQSKNDPGAAMTSTLEFNSATYYRFIALNLDMLADEDHLKEIKREERIEIVKTFIKSCLMAMPSARKNSMNGNALPGYIKCVVRDEGHPIQLVNAFENPVCPKDGKSVFEISVEKLNAEYLKINERWSLKEALCVTIQDSEENEKTNKMEKLNLADILKQVENHVK
jgi:CRISPR system Cascade subunit CasC